MCFIPCWKLLWKIIVILYLYHDRCAQQATLVFRDNFGTTNLATNRGIYCMKFDRINEMKANNINELLLILLLSYWDGNKTVFINAECPYVTHCQHGLSSTQPRVSETTLSSVCVYICYTHNMKIYYKLKHGIVHHIFS